MINALLSCAVEAARTAGALQREARAAGVHVEARGPADIVTATDLACERAIEALVRQRFPDHGLLGEEGTSHATDAPWLWIVDPLDGTKNFAHGSARCGVSIAVLRGGEAEVAVVYAPFVDELFTAVRGEGAWRNSARIRVSATATPREAMVTTAITYAAREADATQLARVVRVFGAVQALRSMGCAALDLADVACGRLDAYFEPGLKPWDTAAGALLVREAGGVVTAFDGARHTPDAPDLLASNGALHPALRALVGGTAR